MGLCSRTIIQGKQMSGRGSISIEGHCLSTFPKEQSLSFAFADATKSRAVRASFFAL